MELLNPYLYAADVKLLSYENAWIQYVKHGEIMENVISPTIYDSWRRCAALKMDPFSKEKPPVVSDKNLRERLRKNQYILNIVQPFMTLLFDIVNKDEFVVIFSDPEGVILKTLCSERMEISCRKTNTCPGSDRSEQKAGTNSISMAIMRKQSVQLAGCQHYRQLFHHWACSSSPVCTQEGEVLCVLSIAGKYELANEHTLGMVHLAAKAVEKQYYIDQINRDFKKRNNQLSTLLSMIPDGILYIEESRILQANNAILELLGKGEDEVIGRNLYEVINTRPPLGNVLDRNPELKDSQIVLMGADRSYKCLVSYEKVRNESEIPFGQVLKFTQLQTIERMASKIHSAAKYSFSNLIGESPVFKESVLIAKKAAGFDSRVIITGESGTGKEMFAQAIHNDSSRQNGPFLPVDCGAIPHELFESELFGYEKGAFTGASKEGKAGLIEKASGGTLFLDEIGNLPLDMQVKLLRVLQEGCIFRVGGREPLPVDVRVIAATNANLKEAVDAGTFREDLYYRLNVFHIQLPPLRERKEDIPLLIRHIIKTTDSLNSNIQIAPEAMDIFQSYHWPGNVRQLSNAVERAVIMSDGHTIRPQDLSRELVEAYESHPSQIERFEFRIGEETLDAATRKYVRFILDRNGGNISKTARQLNVSRSTVYSYLSGKK